MAGIVEIYDLRFLCGDLCFFAAVLVYDLRFIIDYCFVAFELFVVR